MAEKYVKLNDIIETLEHEWGYEGMREDLQNLPTADVVPRAEVEATLKCYKDTVKEEVNQLEYKLAGVMHSVDKWLDGDELEQDEVNRAATMREKTLRIVEGLQAEVERLTIELQGRR